MASSTSQAGASGSNMAKDDLWSTKVPTSPLKIEVQANITKVKGSRNEKSWICVRDMILCTSVHISQISYWWKPCIEWSKDLTLLGEWLGSKCWWRTWQATKCFGEEHVSFEPKISECDFVAFGQVRKDRERRKLKRLSTCRKRNQTRCC